MDVIRIITNQYLFQVCHPERSEGSIRRYVWRRPALGRGRASHVCHAKRRVVSVVNRYVEEDPSFLRMTNFLGCRYHLIAIKEILVIPKSNKSWFRQLSAFARSCSADGEEEISNSLNH
ncbi:hypothetical protein SAMN05428975_1652 [Mucilaginibacter sp. OK268]|jgi:hypothetical protein|nr:hypothetical protein SAMN05428975_1652 [Mucilaginibacter sp. OK268]